MQLAQRVLMEVMVLTEPQERLVIPDLQVQLVQRVAMVLTEPQEQQGPQVTPDLQEPQVLRVPMLLLLVVVNNINTTADQVTLSPLQLISSETLVKIDLNL